MNHRSRWGVGLAAALVLAALTWQWSAAGVERRRSHEYVTIRWAGRDNTQIVRPGGQVEFVGPELRKMTRPDRADERVFFMNTVMNGLTKEGYRFSGMTSDEIVMEREVMSE